MKAIAVSCFAAAAVAAIFLAAPAPVVLLNARACDMVTSWVSQSPPSDRILLVEIDDRSLARYGRWPWPRSVLAKLVDRLYDDRAATVVLDLMFPEEDNTPAPDAGPSSTETNDATLAAALARGISVVGYSFQFAPVQETSPAQIADPLPLVVSDWARSPGREPFQATGAVPTTPLIGASSDSGFLNAAPDRDGRLRLMPLVIEYREKFYPSLALAVLNAYRNTHWMQLESEPSGELSLRLDDMTVPLEGPACMRVQFRGEGPVFARVSALDVLSGVATAGSLKGKIAVVGGAAAGLASSVPTQMHPRISSVEIQATALDNLMHGDFIRRPASAPVWEALLSLVAALTATGLLLFARPRWAVLAALCGIFAAWPLSALLLSTTRTLISPLPFTATAGANLATLALLGYRREKHRADQAAKALVSARDRTRQLIVYNESRFERLVENVNDAIMAEDLQGRIVFANRRFREYFAVDADADAVVGSATDSYVAAEWRPIVRDLHNRILRADDAPDHIEYEGLRKDGSHIWIEALVTRVEEEGEVVGVQAALRDITARRRLEDQFLQAQKMESVGMLAGGVAHDFNNLITVIAGYCELLLTDGPLEETVRAHVEQIAQASSRAGELTQQLLAFGRKQLARPRPLDLNGIVASARNLLRMLVGEEIEVVTQLGDVGLVLADEGQLHQVLMNLAANARDSMSACGGTMTIETRGLTVDAACAAEHPEIHPGQYVELTVADTGSGMTEEVRRRIFEPFYTTKERGKGTGLGLATVYGIVRQSRGTVWATSEVGKGSVFHICLPLLESGTEVAGMSVSNVAALAGSETVLLVEDQEMVLRFATRVLETYGYRVLRAPSGPQALTLAHGYRETIHLMVTDVIMPGMNGRALAGAMRKARPGLRVLFTSGYPEDVMGERGVLAADVEYLPKPYTPKELLQAIRKALGESALGIAAGK